ncbi:RmlC-like cupin domain-containing protein [Truncatella angustata]|uniref:RmlC-like cupin domain-containing protein n=1 Tax=Truncatella angustata TaxID=152316 RepID=A0A9P8UPG1_9PEZI|nr:RmlC-like cupin domain-containing protein [Truncatella angustata]KAH6655827.1 RmlC-like cupin domain-containing protein [Truncatella angustata]
MPCHCPKPVILDAKTCLSEASSSFQEASRGNTTWSTLFSSPQTPTSSMSAGVATCPSNGSLALHRHQQPEIYYILSGSGIVQVDGVRHQVSKDTVIWIPGNAEHGVSCGPDNNLVWFYVFPEGSFESVIYRFSNEEGEAFKQSI